MTTTEQDTTTRVEHTPDIDRGPDEAAPPPRGEVEHGTAVAVRDVEPSPGALALRSTQMQWSPEQRAALFQIGLATASNADLAVFLHVSQRTGLDPFSRQIYMIKRWDAQAQAHRWTIQTGIDGFRIIADRRPEYRGQLEPQWCGKDGVWRDVWLESVPPVAARIGVLRSDFATPIYGVALFREYAQTKAGGGLTSMWAGKPAHMIAKCAEALALRKAFPNDLSGIYTEEEMARDDLNPGMGRGPMVVDAVSVDELTGQPPQQATAVRTDQAPAEQAEAEPEAGDPFARFATDVVTAATDGATKEGVNDLWNQAKAGGWLDRPIREGEETTVRAVIMSVAAQIKAREADQPPADEPVDADVVDEDD